MSSHNAYRAPPVDPASAVPFPPPQTAKLASLKVGWCGLGAMGYFMARNLSAYRASAYPGASPMLVYNRTTAKAEQLQSLLGAEHVEVARTPSQLASECDVVLTSLANDAVVRAVYEEYARALKEAKPTKPKIFVELSTVYPALAGELDTLISSVPNAHFLSGPVFGPPAAADAAQLICVLAGNYASKQTVAHLLVPGIGRKAMDLGANVEKAATFKLIGNSMILGSLEILAEAFTLSEKAGIGAPVTYEFVKDMFPAPPFINYGGRMVRDDFDGTKGFAIDGGLKDANHMRRLVTDLNCPMPVVDAAHQHLLTARAQQAAEKLRGDATFDILDWSSLIAGARVAAGLDAFDSAKNPQVVKE
ncbi:hypothetical protein AcW1_002889 [Taiwanofungus camphoratus]|nr:hypothetical protein AcV5_001927 [Antrodia cinnamomea]KAI0942204.1 hypothetical protein AcW1_002889 [Antrodia cinnamomea]